MGEAPVWYVRSGWLHPVTASRIYGWAIGGDPLVPVSVTVSINGNDIGTVLADEPFESVVRQKIHPTGRCGFSLSLDPSLKLERGDLIRVNASESDVSIAYNLQRYGMASEPFIAEDVQNMIVIGNSHTICMNKAYGLNNNPSQDVRFVLLLNQIENGIPNQRVMKQIQHWFSFSGAMRDPIMVISPWGNEHNSLGLVNHPRPFDFVHPDAPDLPLNESAEIVPFAAILQSMERLCAEALQIATELSHFQVKRRYWIEAPPPIASEEYIRAFSYGFRESIDAKGVSPAGLRYKVWLLRSSVIRSWCQAHGWGFIPVPDIAKDENGFLSHQAWPYFDAVHGNTWFGKVMLEEVLTVAGKEMV